MARARIEFFIPETYLNPPLKMLNKSYKNHNLQRNQSDLILISFVKSNHSEKKKCKYSKIIDLNSKL